MTSPSERPARIVFLDRETLSPETRLRAPGFAHKLVVHEGTTPDQVAERIASADVVITNKAPLRRDSIRGAERLRLIAVAATGQHEVAAAGNVRRDRDGHERRRHECCHEGAAEDLGLTAGGCAGSATDEVTRLPG